MKTIFLWGMLLFVITQTFAEVAWQPAHGPLMTPWAIDVTLGNAWPEYPRPQMVRQRWQNLNGLWEYAIVSKDAAQPANWDGEILVPFPVESALSGVKKSVGKDNRLWYRRTVSIPADWRNNRVLLHFGAVDWKTTVWVNQIKVGEHKGGYNAFSFDITDALEVQQPAQIVIAVWDPTSDGYQPRGKQVNQPNGCWYTAVTGIWQTVWLEPVSRTYIRSIKITPDLDTSHIQVSADVAGADAGDYMVRATAGKDHSQKSGKAAQSLQINLKKDQYQAWTPDAPRLYDLTVEILKDGTVCDRVKSYFALRKLEVEKDKNGINRIFLNNQPIFLYGPLDQGWWPDGLYTAPSDVALRYDLEVLKAMGMNCLRKHVKVEPLRYYYHCDTLGLIVWQDMPSGDSHIGRDNPDLNRSAESEANFRTEWKAIIEMLYNSPSVGIWCPFNEGWGQFKTNEILDWTKQMDPTRLVDGPSGWQDRGGGDLIDKHSYPDPTMFPVERSRVSVLGEFGGLGLPLPDHLWWDKRNWGYKNLTSKEELTENYIRLMEKLPPLIGNGLGAAIYTQTTDVEGEVNGLMTYDRKVIKLNTDKIRPYHLKLYESPPVYRTVLPTSKMQPLAWRYTFDKPMGQWYESDYDDTDWKSGKGMFGTEGTPNVNVGTEWNSSDIWIRREFKLDTVPEDLLLTLYYDEDAEVYINGVLAVEVQRYTTDYVFEEIAGQAKQSLRKGVNTVAVHCKNTSGGQAIDVGFVERIKQE